MKRFIYILLFISLLFGADDTNKDKNAKTTKSAKDSKKKLDPKVEAIKNMPKNPKIKPNNSRVLICNTIFEERKSELISKIKDIEEKQETLRILQESTNITLKKKEENIKKKTDVAKKYYEDAKKAQLAMETAKKENAKILEDIKKVIQDKLTITYSKMKPASAATILGAMDLNLAAKIIYSLDEKIVASIISKMPPQKGADITKLIEKGPPFIPKKPEKPAKK